MQNVNGEFMGVVGDSDVNQDLFIQPTWSGGSNPGGVINFLNFTRVWAAAISNAAAPTGGTSVLINCPANTLCSEITFNGLTAHGGANQTSPIININRNAGGPINLTIANSTICSFGGSGSGEAAIELTLSQTGFPNGAGFWTIANNRIGHGCGTSGTTATPIGILIATTVGGSGNTGFLTITGNDISQSGAPIQFTPNGNERMVIANNLGIDDTCEPLTSAATINLTGVIASCYNVTGTTTITTVNGVWINRKVRLIAANGLALQTGGAAPGFCGVNTTLAATQQSTLEWDPIHNCWQHTP
jgi:hypothetical protein